MEFGAPARFVEAHAADLADAATHGPLLDLACGRGRHAVWAARQGLRVVAIDRNAEYLIHLSNVVIEVPGSIEIVELDLETPEPPDLGDQRFGAIIVSRYLHRPLFPAIEQALAPGGILLYETFIEAQRSLDWGPKRDDFLLRSGELPGSVPGLTTLTYDEGPSADEPSAQTARLLAKRDLPGV